MNRTLQYLNKLKQNNKTILRIAFLNPDETIQKEITNEVYNISGNLNINYQNGARRTCTITINNDRNLFPAGWNGFALGQKFQLWTGLYLDEAEQDPYVISQGIFYILNPKEIYSPDKKTISIQGVDKWAYLDGRLFGFLNGTYKSSANNENMRIDDLVLGLLQQNKYSNTLKPANNILEMIDLKKPIFNDFLETRLENQYMQDTGYVIYIDSKNSTFPKNGGSKPNLYIIKNEKKYQVNYTEIDNHYKYTVTTTTLTPDYQTVFQREVSTFITPYSVVTEIGKTFADIILEYNTMLMGQVYYDREGYLRFNAISTSLNDYSNHNREIAWHFTVTEQELLNLEIESKFDSVFNDVIVLGAIINGARAKARIQNRDPSSETSIDRIGIKTKPPYESDQYQSDAQCFDLAKYYAQTDMAMERSGSISTLPIYHLDVGQIVTLSTENNMTQEEYLVTGISYNFSGTMNLNVTNLRYFSNWTKIDTEGNVIND
jgi:hypothetical protein